jgi:hypothetical protein
MRTRNFLLVLVVATLFSACSKDKNPKGVFRAKLVASFCAYNIVEIQDKKYYDLGMEWTAPNGTVNKNVFTVYNHCDFGKEGMKVNDVFTCRIIERPVSESCAVCFGYMDTPPLNRNIEVVYIE